MGQERIHQPKTASSPALTPAKKQSPPAFQLQASPTKTAPAPKTSGPSAVDLYKKAVSLNEKFNSPDTVGSALPGLAKQLLAISEQMDEKSKQAFLFNDPTARAEVAKVLGVSDLDDADKLVDEIAPFNQKDEWEAIENADSWDKDHVNKGYFDKSGKLILRNGGGDSRAKIEAQAADKNTGVRKASEADKAGQSELNTGFEIDITAEELFQALGIAGKASDLQKKKIGEYLKEAKKAFRLARIDTIEAQANFLAHAAGETRMKSMTEGLRSESNYNDEPFTHKYDRHSKDGVKRYGRHWDPDAVKKDGTKGKMVRGKDMHAQHSIDPQRKIESNVDNRKVSDWEFSMAMQDTFIGRGPVQVTNNFNYAKALIYLEQLARTSKGQDAIEIHKAVKAIKKNPGEAANPKYAFLFSAAYMQMSGGLDRAAELGDKSAREKSGNPNEPANKPDFNGTDAASRWVSGGTTNFKAKLAEKEKILADLESKHAALPPGKEKDKVKKEVAAAKKMVDYYKPLEHGTRRKAEAYENIKRLLLTKLNKAKAKKAAANKTP